MNFYINFDRLQFYYYHKQNFTEYADMILSAVYILQEDRGGLIELMVRTSSS
jgi:hypothetical protein